MEQLDEEYAEAVNVEKVQEAEQALKKSE